MAIINNPTLSQLQTSGNYLQYNAGTVNLLTETDIGIATHMVVGNGGAARHDLVEDVAASANFATLTANPVNGQEDGLYRVEILGQPTTLWWAGDGEVELVSTSNQTPTPYGIPEATWRGWLDSNNPSQSELQAAYEAAEPNGVLRSLGDRIILVNDPGERGFNRFDGAGGTDVWQAGGGSGGVDDIIDAPTPNAATSLADYKVGETRFFQVFGEPTEYRAFKLQADGSWIAQGLGLDSGSPPVAAGGMLEQTVSNGATITHDGSGTADPTFTDNGAGTGTLVRNGNRIIRVTGQYTSNTSGAYNLNHDTGSVVVGHAFGPTGVQPGAINQSIISATNHRLTGLGVSLPITFAWSF